MAFKTSIVVYFDQRSGAAHSKRWSKYTTIDSHTYQQSHIYTFRGINNYTRNGPIALSLLGSNGDLAQDSTFNLVQQGQAKLSCRLFWAYLVAKHNLSNG